jgi:hypothetical protein
LRLGAGWREESGNEKAEGDGESEGGFLHDGNMVEAPAWKHNSAVRERLK